MQLNPIAGLEVLGDGFGAHPRKPDLTLRVLRIDKVDVQRNLPVNADGLDTCHQRRTRTPEHASSVAGSVVRDPASRTATQTKRRDQVSSRPFVSGIQIQARAAITNASDEIDSAAPKPCVCASVPTANGAAALTMRPML